MFIWCDLCPSNMGHMVYDFTSRHPVIGLMHVTLSSNNFTLFAKMWPWKRSALISLYIFIYCSPVITDNRIYQHFSLFLNTDTRCRYQHPVRLFTVLLYFMICQLNYVLYHTYYIVHIVVSFYCIILRNLIYIKGQQSSFICKHVAHYLVISRAKP